MIILQGNTLVTPTQELPKLLKGYHKCSLEEATKLAGFILNVKYGKNPSSLPSIAAEWVVWSEWLSGWCGRSG